MYANGWGVTEDDAEAAAWYRKAAERGATPGAGVARGAPGPLTTQRETATDSRIYWIRVAVLVGVGFIVPIQAEEWSLNVATFHRASNACAVPSAFESAPATPRAVVPSLIQSVAALS